MREFVRKLHPDDAGAGGTDEAAAAEGQGEQAGEPEAPEAEPPQPSDADVLRAELAQLRREQENLMRVLDSRLPRQEPEPSPESEMTPETRAFLQMLAQQTKGIVSQEINALIGFQNTKAYQEKHGLTDDQMDQIDAYVASLVRGRNREDLIEFAREKVTAKQRKAAADAEAAKRGAVDADRESRARKIRAGASAGASSAPERKSMQEQLAKLTGEERLQYLAKNYANMETIAKEQGLT